MRSPKRIRRHSNNSNIMNEPATAEIDRFLATSMAELSFQERQANQEDLHGVSTNKPEDAEQTERWLTELEGHLNSIKAGSCYEIAERTNPDIVQRRSFRLMFLRGNRYKTKDAAKQMLSYFDWKLRLFGKEKLGKDITLDDLNDDDKESLQSGSYQVSPMKDRAGRTILLGLPGLARSKHIDNDLRARYYFFMAVLRSEQSQIRGVVLVSYALDEFRDRSQGRGFAAQTKLALAMPIHWAGMHFCTDDHWQYALISTCLKLIPSHMRARFKLHFGSQMECQYSLKPYGISPINGPQLEAHMRWYHDCEIHDSVGNGDIASTELSSQNSTATALDPISSDVLFGGKKNNNGGNKRLRGLVRDSSKAYDMGTKMEKRALIDHVVREIQKTGGRFLKQSENNNNHSDKWEAISIEDACSKIAQAFRNNRRSRASQSDGQPGAAVVLPEPPPKTVDRPNPNDVLFGRKRSNDGNKRVRQLVGDLSNEYDIASKARKTQIADSVVQEIQRQGGRFLKQNDDDKWEEVPNDFARSKISKHFRNNRRPPLVKENSDSAMSK
eukprot:scaffold26816_cov166-Cylindrotheca_fusiformis.AAC.1